MPPFNQKPEVTSDGEIVEIINALNSLPKGAGYNEAYSALQLKYGSNKISQAIKSPRNIISNVDVVKLNELDQREFTRVNYDRGQQGEKLLTVEEFLKRKNPGQDEPLRIKPTKAIDFKSLAAGDNNEKD